MHDCKVDDGARALFVKSEEGVETGNKVWSQLKSKLEVIQQANPVMPKLFGLEACRSHGVGVTGQQSEFLTTITSYGGNLFSLDDRGSGMRLDTTDDARISVPLNVIG